MEGSRAAIASLERPLEGRQPGMLKEINKRFDAVQDELNKSRKGDGFQPYSEVKQEQRKELSRLLDDLTEEVSKAQGVIAK